VSTFLPNLLENATAQSVQKTTNNVDMQQHTETMSKQFHER